MIRSYRRGLSYSAGISRIGKEFFFVLCVLTCGLTCSVSNVGATNDEKDKQQPKPPSIVADPKTVGGESNSVIQVANLVYAGTKSSECFSDHFLTRAERESSISTSRRFHTVKLASDEVFHFPLVIMTGEGEFTLLEEERQNLRVYIERGGFLLASAGCSSEDWNRSFRREMQKTFPENNMKQISMDHMVFHTVNDIPKLEAKHGEPQPIEGIHFGDRLGVLYSQDGLNDTKNSVGCCCCGGNEIVNAEAINVNILVYTLLK
ncbi:MAG: DUF4159 domain-containing protein [Pirellula sp.]|jgi:hypothetical protein|nr:DUF4159 domain-containing protein [Pirellula sp.]